jgi:small-conductance mechanosensitive channel
MDFHYDRIISRLTGLSRSNRFSATVVIAAILVCCCCLRACSAPAQQRLGIIGTEQQGAIRSALVGEWVCNIGHSKIVFKLTPEGDFSLGDQKGQYALEANTVRLKTDTSEVSYQFELTATELTLSGGDLRQPLKFTRMRSVGTYEDWLSYLSAKSLNSKLKRIAVIIVIVVSCRMLLLLFRMIIHFVIYYDRGPLKFIFRSHKSRTMTIYSLLINLSKYTIYLFSLGFVLRELGVNYTAYLASLSVVGLAIGFGSQGLVQDMVTGFFIVFEEQFNVGDMVEIPPHVGVVQELGLRMTRLRNYLGQQVVIPNRNIATVGKYIKGSQHVTIDVATVNREAAERIKSPLLQIVEEIGSQFEEVIISTQKTAEIISLSTDEYFARVSLAIWPQQQWVIEQEAVPRIRLFLKSKGFEIPNDRVVVFYHAREQLPVGPRKHNKRGSNRAQSNEKK